MLQQCNSHTIDRVLASPSYGKVVHCCYFLNHRGTHGYMLPQDARDYYEASLKSLKRVD